MANYASLKSAIQQVVKTNGNNEITGALLQQSLLAMINSLGADYQFVGVATLSTNPGTPDQNVFYLAGPGIYPNFNNANVLDGEIGVFTYNGSWVSTKITVNKTTVINAGDLRFSPSVNTFETLADALANIPYEYRAERAIVYFQNSAARIQFYFFISNNINDSAWLNTSYWRKGLTEFEANSIFEQLSNKTTSINEQSTNTQYPGAKAVYDFGKNANSVANKIAPYADNFELLKPYTVFNGTSSVGQCTPITLSNEGDTLEIEILPNAMTGNEHYAFVNWQTNQVSIGVNQNYLYVRANDNNRTWLLQGVSIGGPKSKFVLKIQYSGGKTLFYIDNVLLSTYNGQLPITLRYWGLYSSGGNNYWDGRVGYIKINGTEYNTLTSLPGWTGTDVKALTLYGFLTQEQAEQLANITEYPNMIVRFDPTTDGGNGTFFIYQRYKNTNIYFRLTLNHTVDNTDAVYMNLWRIASDGGVYQLVNNSLVDLGYNLLIGAENEFTFKYVGTDDFTGGYHGDERIDSPGCFANFYIDGILITAAQMSAAFEKKCDNFYMLQKSTLHETTPSGGSPVTGHPVIAYHYKRTSFEDGGFYCINRIDFDLTGSNFNQIVTESLFTGLVCVAKNCATKAYADNFVINDESLGDNHTTLIQNANGGVVEMYSDAVMSCRIDSNTRTEENKNLNIMIWDRPGDTKYYRYANNKTFVTGDTYISDVKVSWRYKK